MMNTPEAKSAGYGVMTDDKWASTQKLQVDFGGQEETVPADKLWTSRFVK